MKKYYLDACIWRDYFENRSDNFRPLGEWAFRLIKKIIDEGGLFVISDHLINELERYDFSKDKIFRTYGCFRKKPFSQFFFGNCAFVFVRWFNF